MKIRTVTMSDLREDVSYGDAVSLLSESPLAELAIQAHLPKMERGGPRHCWTKKLVRASEFAMAPLSVAIHVNKDWCLDFCKGKIAPELREWLESENRFTGLPTIARWQLNLGSFAGRIDPDAITKLGELYPNREWIFQYNENTAENIAILRKNGMKFSILFDASGGRGVQPAGWRAPVYNDIPHGYSGGLGPDNVSENLDKIAAVVPDGAEIWIDAEGQLKNPATGRFDCERARTYLRRALEWDRRRGR